MSMLRKFFDDAERRYNYRVKTIVELNDAALNAIENVILKYNPFDMSQVSKTILHRNPLDFPNVTSAEVYSVDICLGLPVSPSVLRQEISVAMGITKSEVMVRGENDPTEIETQRIVAGEDLNSEKGEVATLLDTAMDYPEGNVVDGATMYGDKYNGKLVSLMKQIADERTKTSVIGKTHNYPDVKSDVSADGGPLPDLGEIDIIGTSKHGNIDDNTKTYKRVYKNGRVVSKDGVAVTRGK